MATIHHQPGQKTQHTPFQANGNIANFFEPTLDGDLLVGAQKTQGGKPQGFEKSRYQKDIRKPQIHQKYTFRADWQL